VRTDAYGVPRADGALALDAWGADYEAWARVEPAPPALDAARAAVRALAERASFAREAAAGTPALANSLAVNYYRGGAVGIPAHQDTVSSLVDGSAIYVLSLGATREFQLGGADAAGRARVEAPLRTWRPRHGDLVVLGPETNARCCHCVPRAPGDGLRVSIVFRSVDKSFLRKAPPRVATYASGAARVVAAEAVVGDARRHLSELISAREAAKAPAETRPADLAQFYRGRGPMAALLAV
jgi:alkylated DNA repair dioxygenase AlkB